ncbi:SET domain-containing protein [Citrus sinensis]|uniref:SET domain-containing protein n=1 Tax=Citrus sinensis TaxID=2711 RepID=A0ACB8MRC2_CITSI|nr:SET domain-containing protein [Citrus sinensis]KAH9788112.1 SET domain-containing protein [Citrus sinensis]
MEISTEAKLEPFLQWLQVNKVELRGCKIKYSDESKGFGIFSSNEFSDGVLLVVPLDLAITPMRVLQDPLIGPECRAMFEDGEVDDRFLMILFLTVERLRKNSSWKPYLDMLPTTFGNPLWFTDDELLELKGTTLYRATELQKQNLLTLYDDKVKDLVKKLLVLDGDSESEVSFEDFLWANSIFWTRALNIPLPHSYVFPQNQEDLNKYDSINNSAELSNDHNSRGELINGLNDIKNEAQRVNSQVNGATSTLTSTQGETLWIEGLVPGIDFCNHDLKAAATWEVDGTGLITGVPFSISGSDVITLILSNLKVERSSFHSEKEISISYGNKGNEELLYLYGFVIDNNPDDYLMIHYPAEAIHSIPLSDSKALLLEEQKAQLRCLLPKSLLEHGFFAAGHPKDGNNDNKLEVDRISSFSWSGQRRMPSYLNKLVFPENFLTALRTIAMQEDEISKVSSLLEEAFLVCISLFSCLQIVFPNNVSIQVASIVYCCTRVTNGCMFESFMFWFLHLIGSIIDFQKLVGSGGERQPSDAEVRAAVWETCGDSGALQLLVDLLQAKLTELEESSGMEDYDSELLLKSCITESQGQHASCENNSSEETNGWTQHKMSRKTWSSIVYRRGQKELALLFLKEAEHALQLALTEGN